MQHEQSHNFGVGISRRAYQCPECRHGLMYSSNEEGQSEYTDRYACNNCQHSDHITTASILWSQTATSTLGLIICWHLMSDHLTMLIGNFDNALYSITSRDVWLSLLGASFLFGFCYILYQAYKSFRHRRKYIPL